MVNADIMLHYEVDSEITTVKVGEERTFITRIDESGNYTDAGREQKYRVVQISRDVMMFLKPQDMKRFYEAFDEALYDESETREGLNRKIDSLETKVAQLELLLERSERHAS